jgi:serine/threonine protein kinase
MSYYEDTLYKKIPELKDDEIKPILYSLLRAVNYCHHNHLIHRDIKPQNILINENNEVILIDFGLSKIDMLDDDYTSLFTNYFKHSEKVQTLWYRSPEVLVNFCSTNYKIDMWSIGITFLDMIMRKNGYIGTLKSVEQMNNYLNYIKYNDNFQPVNKFIKKNNLVIEDNNIFNKLEEMNFDKNGIDLLKKLLEYNPDQRFNCKSAIKHKYFDGYNRDLTNIETEKLKELMFTNSDKLNYNTFTLLYFLKSSNINMILVEWVVYILDYFTITNNIIDIYDCFTTEDICIYLVYLFIKLINGDSYSLELITRHIFGTNISEYKLNLYIDLEMEILDLLNFNLYIETPGFKIYRLFTDIYKDNLISYNQLVNLFDDLEILLELLLQNKIHFKYTNNVIYSTLVYYIIENNEIYLPENYEHIFINKSDSLINKYLEKHNNFRHNWDYD